MKQLGKYALIKKGLYTKKIKLCGNKKIKRKTRAPQSPTDSGENLLVICILKAVVLSVKFLLAVTQHPDLFFKQAAYKDRGANVCVRPYSRVFSVPLG